MKCGFVKSFTKTKGSFWSFKLFCYPIFVLVTSRQTPSLQSLLFVLFSRRSVSLFPPNDGSCLFFQEGFKMGLTLEGAVFSLDPLDNRCWSSEKEEVPNSSQDVRRPSTVSQIYTSHTAKRLSARVSTTRPVLDLFWPVFHQICDWIHDSFTHLNTAAHFGSNVF